MGTVGTRIRELRKLRKMNQTELAVLVGVDQSTISDIERDETVFNVEILAGLAEALEAPADYILRGISVAWPFQKIELSRVLALSQEDRTFVEGGLAQILRSVEASTKTPDETSVTQPDRYSALRGAKQARQRGAIPPIEDGSNEVGSNRRTPRGKRS